uniref:Ig-like domain-containing protein n=1 Tax=Nothobranchius furzeri TaxID=105023 RepID=A0A8C6KLV9_NOTFU
MALIQYYSCFLVLQAQKLEFQSEVTGYLGHDVILPCELIQGQNLASLSLVQWNFQQAGKNKTIILVYSPDHGISIRESPLKGRVKISKYSLVINNVSQTDHGAYACEVTIFPGGKFEATIALTVEDTSRDQSSILRPSFIVKDQVRSEFIQRVNKRLNGMFPRSQEVVYAPVKPKQQSRDPTFSDEKHKPTVHADDVTYSSVKVLYQSNETICL